MNKIVWTKFYWQDWLADVGVRRCSLAARGLWMDMLCIAAQHDPIGYVAIEGEGLTHDDIARMAGIASSEVSILIGELERNGVFARDRKSTIYSRRMVRDARKAAENKKNGKLGGNPSVCFDSEKTSTVNPQVNPSVKAQEPEARSQEPRKEKKYSSDFEDWWQAYPRRPTMSKPRAYAEYARLSDNDRSLALSALTPFKAQISADKTEARFILHAERFLRNRIFDNFVETSAKIIEMQQGVLVQYDSPQWDAWEKHLRARGERMPVRTTYSTGRRFPTEFPPTLQAAE